VGRKGYRDGVRVAFVGERADVIENGPVADVDTVEVPDCENRIGEVGTRSVKLMEKTAIWHERERLSSFEPTGFRTVL